MQFVQDRPRRSLASCGLLASYDGRRENDNALGCPGSWRQWGQRIATFSSLWDKRSKNLGFLGSQRSQRRAPCPNRMFLYPLGTSGRKTLGFPGSRGSRLEAGWKKPIFCVEAVEAGFF